jgi:hypothetical protein
MKTFNQFLYECYLSEAPADRVKSPKEQAEWDKINKKEEDAKKRKAQKGLTGAAADPTKQFKKPQGTTTNVSGSDVRGETGNSGTPGRSPRPYSGTTSPAARVEPAGGENPQQAPVSPSRTKAELENTLASRRAAREAAQKAKDSTALALRPQVSPGSAAKEAEKAAAKTATKATGKSILKGLGRVVGPASAVLDVADERSKGSGWLRSLAKGAVVAAGGAAGGAGGSVAGPVGTVAGAVGGSMAAGKAFDTVAGANAVERKAIATANRKSQSGGEIKGIGGPTSFSQKKPGGAAFISTGSGPQRRTAQLAKTSVVTGPGGKQEVGNLAFKDGKAVYKRADTKSLAQTSSNPLERIGRTIAAGAYKDNDAKLAATKLATARTSDATRNQKLGVKLKPGG